MLVWPVRARGMDCSCGITWIAVALHVMLVWPVRARADRPHEHYMLWLAKRALHVRPHEHSMQPHNFVECSCGPIVIISHNRDALSVSYFSFLCLSTNTRIRRWDHRFQVWMCRKKVKGWWLIMVACDCASIQIWKIFFWAGPHLEWFGCDLLKILAGWASSQAHTPRFSMRLQKNQKYFIALKLTSVAPHGNVACSLCFDYLAIYSVSNAKNLCAQQFFGLLIGILWGTFFWASNWFRLCMKIIAIVHHARNSAQMSFSSANMKFPNQGHTNAFLACANKHYVANLGGVNARLRAQSCPSN